MPTLIIAAFVGAVATAQDAPASRPHSTSAPTTGPALLWKYDTGG